MTSINRQPAPPPQATKIATANGDAAKGAPCSAENVEEEWGCRCAEGCGYAHGYAFLPWCADALGQELLPQEVSPRTRTWLQAPDEDRQQCIGDRACELCSRGELAHGAGAACLPHRPCGRDCVPACVLRVLSFCKPNTKA